MKTDSKLPRPRIPAAMTTAEANAFKHLSRNAESCVRRNIRVHVENINTGRTVAMCTAEQCSSGLFKRQLNPADLVKVAERALAPLRGVGITPLITVRHHTLNNSSGNGTVGLLPPEGSWARVYQRFLGYLHKVSAPRTQTMDPFGWRRATREANMA